MPYADGLVPDADEMKGKCGAGFRQTANDKTMEHETAGDEKYGLDKTNEKKQLKHGKQAHSQQSRRHVNTANSLSKLPRDRKPNDGGQPGREHGTENEKRNAHRRNSKCRKSG